MDPPEGTRGSDRTIGTQGKHCTRIEQISECVSPACPVAASLVDHGHIVGGVERLHRGYQAHGRQTFQVVRAAVLHVLDAVRCQWSVRPLLFRQNLAEDVQ